MAKMKIAITGSSGFIGTHLCEALSKDHDILPITRASHGDFEQITNWHDILKNCDAVIHLAARVHRTDERHQDEAAYKNANTALTQNILDGAIKAKVKNFIFLSSAAVYGSADSAVKEDVPLAPTNAYGSSKAAAEQIIMTARDKIRPIILRPPLVYGPGCGANFLMLAKAVKKGIPLPLASVKNARSFCDVGNVVSFITHALENEKLQGVYNIADDGPLSTPDLIRIMADHMNMQARLFPFPPAILKAVFGTLGYQRQIDGLTGSFILDTSKAKDAGWTPPYSTQEGLKRSLSEA